MHITQQGLILTSNDSFSHITFKNHYNKHKKRFFNEKIFFKNIATFYDAL